MSQKSTGTHETRRPVIEVDDDLGRETVESHPKTWIKGDSVEIPCRPSGDSVVNGPNAGKRGRRDGVVPKVGSPPSRSRAVLNDGHTVRATFHDR